MTHLALQPLRIPSGWSVEYHSFFEGDPDFTEMPVEQLQMYFNQDLLQIRHPLRNRLVDLGWYPHGDLAEGNFGLAVYEGDCRGPLLYEFKSRDRLSVVSEIERVLAAVSAGEL